MKDNRAYVNDTPEKFLFDLNDFSNKKSIQDLENEQVTAEDVASARAEGYESGVSETTQRLLNEQTERDIRASENIANALQHLIASEPARLMSKNTDTIRLTLSIAKKLIPQLASKLAEEDIVALIQKMMIDRLDEPRLVVSVHDSALEKLSAKIDEIKASKSFQGHVIMMADENLSPTDCRIEWADGGIEKSFDSLYNKIETIFNAAINGISTEALQEISSIPQAPQPTEPEPEPAPAQQQQDTPLNPPELGAHPTPETS